MQEPAEETGVQGSRATGSAVRSRQEAICRSIEADRISPELTVGGNSGETVRCIP